MIENSNSSDKSFFRKVCPSKLTECRQMKLNTLGWSLLSHYTLESVKINSYKGRTNTIATLQIADRSGQITCLVRGTSVGLLFGLTIDEWKEVESLCNDGEQLFYRQFKDGISRSYKYEQKLFYTFCENRVSEDIFVVVFKRCVNKRNKDKNDAFLDIKALKRCDNHLMDLYVNYFRENVEDMSRNITKA